MKKRAKKSTAAVPKRASRTNASGIYLGFSLQATRFLVHLLKANPGDVVCLEVFDDVAVVRVDGTLFVEQDKSNLATNPLSNRSLQLWKTLHNWMELAESGVIDPNKTTFVIYAFIAAPGAIADAFHCASTADTATAAIAKARDELKLGDPSSKVDDPVATLAHQVLNTDPQRLVAIVKRFSIESGDGNPHGELQRLLLAKLVSEDVYPDVVRWAHGWVKIQVDRLLETKQPARIAQADFHAALLNYVRHHDREDILRSMAGSPPYEAVNLELAVRDYVRQLRLIELDDVDVLEAINDFLRAASDRTIWAEQGLIDEGSLKSLAEELTSTWRNKKRRVTISFSDKPEHLQGQALYSDCIEHDTRLDNLLTPKLFIRGSWHALADDLTIGWHPQYAATLRIAVTGIDMSGKGREG